MSARLPLIRGAGRFRQLPAGDYVPVVAGGTGATDASSARDALGITTALSAKVDKVAGKQLSTEDYSTAEKSKLAGLDPNHFRGVFGTLAALQAAIPTANAGDYAFVDPASGADVIQYLWDNNDSKWVYNGPTAGVTAAQVKNLYESNANTNAYTDADKTKLSGFVATTGQQDTTSGRLLRVGDFGVGGDSIQLSSSVSWDTLTTPGNFYVPGVSGVNNPAIGSNFFLEVLKQGSVIKQIAKQQGTAISFQRFLVGGNWSIWDQSYSSLLSEGVAWITPTILNGWTTGLRRCGYRKRFNSVEMIIGIYGASGTYADGTIVFNMPAGYRPSQAVFFPTGTGLAGSRAQVDANGDVTIYGHASPVNLGFCISYGLT